MKSYKPEQYHHCRQMLLRHVKTVLKADVRGLEQRTVPKLKAYRKRASQSLLALQRKLQNDNGNNFRYLTEDMVTTKLRQKSLQASRGSRQLAFCLAQADRLAALEI
jgi:hypothetical protein